MMLGSRVDAFDHLSKTELILVFMPIDHLMNFDTSSKMTNYVLLSKQDRIYYHQGHDYADSFPGPSPYPSWALPSPNMPDSIHDVSDIMNYEDDSLSFTSEDYENSQHYPSLKCGDSSYPVVCSPESQPKTTDSVDSLTTTTTTVIDPVELQLEFLRTLKKLDRSIQRTNQSRSMVKRLHTASFLERSEWHQIEEDRQQFAEMIHHDSLTRTVF
jgi:hypothetical protein